MLMVLVAPPPAATPPTALIPFHIFYPTLHLLPDSHPALLATLKALWHLALK